MVADWPHHGPRFGRPRPSYAQDGDGAASSATVAFEACAELDEAQVRSELNVIAQEIFATDANGIDLDAIIDRQWDVLGMDALVDRQVDEAVREVRRDEELLDTFLSGWSPERAAESGPRRGRARL